MAIFVTWFLQTFQIKTEIRFACYDINFYVSMVTKGLIQGGGLFIITLRSE